MTDSHNEEEALGKAYDSYLIRRLLRYLRPYKWHAFASLALMMLSALLALAGPLLTQAAVDLFLAPDPSRQPSAFELLLRQCAAFAGLGGSRHHGIVFISLLLLVANMAAFVTQYAQRMVMETLGQNALHDLREEIFTHLQRVSIQFYDRNPVGRLITRLTNDVDALNDVFTSGVIGMLADAALALYVVAWMFRVSWRLAIVCFAILPLLAIFTTWFRRRARSAFREVRVQIAKINSFLQEHLTGIQVIQLFNREAKEMDTFEHINEAHWKANMNTLFYVTLFYPGVEILVSVGVALIIWYGGGQVMREVISIGTLIAFIQLARAFYDPISNISENYNILQAAMASSERIFSLLDEPVTIKSTDGPAPTGRARGRIEFRNVWFAYEGDDWVLKDISFIVEPGEKVALVGHTGAGKTTITNLLLRFYEIQRGQILFDNVDIREMDLQVLRSNFGIVLQDVFLFSGDIASNIRLRDRSITDEMVKSAAREIGAADFIENTNKDYRSEIFERGAGLSVGQKQLIGFARALAFDRCVLILDEATSSIDTETEILIRDAVERLTTGRTSLVIAHRLSTIQSVDKIVVMHKGEIRESGDHQSLLAQRGLYWKLHQLQLLTYFKQTVVKVAADD
jgi:ATP-binding cassette subfamily B protein